MSIRSVVERGRRGFCYRIEVSDFEEQRITSETDLHERGSSLELSGVLVDLLPFSLVRFSTSDHRQISDEIYSTSRASSSSTSHSIDLLDGIIVDRIGSLKRSESLLRMHEMRRFVEDRVVRFHSVVASCRLCEMRLHGRSGGRSLRIRKSQCRTNNVNQRRNRVYLLSFFVDTTEQRCPSDLGSSSRIKVNRSLNLELFSRTAQKNPVRQRCGWRKEETTDLLTMS